MTIAAGKVYVPDGILISLDDYISSDLWKRFPLINVDKTKDIPADYPGPIAVPITFLDKFNPEQFEIVGMTHHNYLEDGRTPYRRVIVRHLCPQLPLVFDLVEWFRKVGMGVDVEFVEQLPEGAVPVINKGGK